MIRAIVWCLLWFHSQSLLTDDSLILQLWVMAKIDNDAEAISRRFQIVVNLGAMLVSDLLDCLKFQNDFAIADGVWDVF